MDTLEAIAARRSIRCFKDIPIPDERLQSILIAATQAPSAKNRQPWWFGAVTGDKRHEMVHVVRDGIARAKARGEGLGSAEATARIIEQAPVTIFVFDPQGNHPYLAHSVGEMLDDLINVQSKRCEMIAAVCLGYTDEQPGARPRRPVSRVARWL